MAAGMQIGAYSVVRELGRGGAGVVYEVSTPGSERRLALKLLHSGYTTPEALLRFGREAQLLAQVQHPSVVRVLDLKRTEAGDPYIVTDLIPGEELAKVARGKPLPWEQSARIVRELADALAQLHAKGIVHRDLKPQNVILHPEGHPVLLDFGLARERESAERLTQTGAFLGTPAYASPEQAEGAKDVQPSADVYSLGALLYFLLSGHAPYSGSVVQILSKLVQGTPPTWPSAEDPSVPPALEAICQRAMRFDVAERTPSAAALRDELDAYLRGDAPSGGQGGRGSLTLALGVLGAVLALGGVGLGVLATRAGDRDPGAEAGPAVALPNGPPQVVPRAKEDERWRGPPSSRVAALARNYASVAQARAQLKEATPETLELLYAVHYRLARSPVWQAVYLDPIAGGAPGRVRPPASVFVQRGKRLITYGGRLPPDRTDLNKVEPGFPKAWTVETGEEMTVARDASGLFVKANVAFPFPKPSRYGSALLFESARRFMAWHADGGAQGLDGSEATMNGYRAKLEELPQWKVSEKDNTPVDKPVTAAAVRGDGSEFALGTGRTGYHLREGALRDNTAVVVRMPYPLRTEDMERTPAAHCEEVPIGQEAVRGLAYGPGEPPPLWILGGRELICWRDGEVETRAEGDAEWFALVVDGRGRPLVGGAQGLTQFDPLGERPSLLPLDDLASVDGLALVGESHAVAVGTSPTGKGAWALLELPNQGEPRVLCSRETDLPYASVAVSEESRRACFMRWDGEFEVWDLDALFPWSEALAFPRATTTSAGPVRPEGAAVELGAQDYAGKSLAEARRSLPAGAAYREQILQRVAANNAKRPLWEGKHAEVDSADGAPPPRSCFLAHNRLVTFGGGRAGGAQAGPKSWSPDGASVVDPTQGRIEVRACFADPRWPNDGILLQGLQDDPLRLDESGTSLGQDPSNLLPLRASWPSEVREALGQHRKLVSVATYAADRRELLLGTVPQGEPAGARVLRIPLHAMPDSWYSAPERESTSSRPTIYNSGREAFNPGAAALSPSLPFDEPVRAIGRGTQRTVWILGRRALVRWQGDSVEGVATAGASERWRDLQVLHDGTVLLIAGSEGLKVALSADPARLVPLPQPHVLDAWGLAVLPNGGKSELREQRLLVVGGLGERATWAVVRVDAAKLELLLLSDLSAVKPGPYVSVSLSPDGALACLMRADGGFEVWDVPALQARALSRR